jgi:predicted transcriptional regulator
MSDKTLKDLTVDAHIAVLHTKVDALIEKQKELTERVRANEKVVAALGVLGTIAIAFIGAGAFAPRAEAREYDYDYLATRNEIIKKAGSFIQEMREWESEQNRTSVDESINNALAKLEIEYGSDGSTEQEELLQFQSNGDQQSIRWGYD